MRIGVFGGTFDPIHLGHLILAEQCREQADLDQVWFVPAARPPHKPQRVLTPFEKRVEMLTLAIAGHPGFRVDDLEKERPGPSYTADTLEEIHGRHPASELFLVIGSDVLPDLPSWYQPERILALATLLIVQRPNHPLLAAEQLEATLRLPEGVRVRQRMVAVPQMDIASRDLRRRAADGRSVRYMVPRAVECYIQEKRLYGAVDRE